MRNDTLYALDRKFEHIHTLGSISGLLGWAYLVNLPPKSADQRGEQSAAIAGQRGSNRGSLSEKGLAHPRVQRSTFDGPSCLLVECLQQAMQLPEVPA